MKTLYIVALALIVTACNSNPHNRDYNRLNTQGCGITYDCVVTGDNRLNQQVSKSNSELVIEKLILDNKS